MSYILIAGKDGRYGPSAWRMRTLVLYSASIGQKNSIDFVIIFQFSAQLEMDEGGEAIRKRHSGRGRGIP